MAEAQSSTDARIGIDALFDLTGTDREAKAYAFLYAAFRRTEVSANPVRDALDCLIPFIVPYTNSISGKQVTADGVKEYLKSTYGFDIPSYAVEQFIVNLQKGGFVEYNKPVRAHFAKKSDTEFGVVKAEIETDFDDVTAELAAYARSMELAAPPASGSWGEALIAFLKTSTERSGPIVAKIKGGLVEPHKVESAIVGAFIRNLNEKSPGAFQKLVRIFMGVLVEEFISSVAEVGTIDPNSKVTVFYDTAVLLRLLGTSGKMLKSATEELNRYLQDIGFSTLYFSGNESEVAGIFDALIYIKDSGKELEGETAAAISAGEVSITDIRLLQNIFPDRLAALNVFPAENLERSAQDNAAYQIDESGFSQYLLAEANAKGRAYGVQNRQHDATYLGTVMRLRKRNRTKDLTACGYVFVTSNKFLAQASRRYLIREKEIQPQHCPPILSLGQIATIAWLVKDHKLVPEKAGRELLCNCFAAVRPDAEWFKYFREGVEKAAGSIDEFTKTTSGTLALQAARRIAQEESFGNSVLVRELNMAEILARSQTEQDRVVAEQQAQIVSLQEAGDRVREEHKRDVERQKAEAEELAEKIRAEAVRITTEEARQSAEEMVREAKLSVGRSNAKRVIFAVRAVSFVAFLAVTSWALYLRYTQSAGTGAFVAAGILALVSLFSFMNLIGVPVVKTLFERMEDRLARLLAQ